MCILILFQNRRPSVYLPTREYPSEQSKYMNQEVAHWAGETTHFLNVSYILSLGLFSNHTFCIFLLSHHHNFKEVANPYRRMGVTQFVYFCGTTWVSPHFKFFAQNDFVSLMVKQVICCFSSVIVTEKTNILLRYLHQQWDKKVRGLTSSGANCIICERRDPLCC